MEKHLQKITLLSVFLVIFNFHLSAQTPSVVRNIRLPLWAEIDAYPELAEAQDLQSEELSYPIKRLHDIAPFLINGMVYGWSFSYTPSDKARNVEENLEITEIVDPQVIKAGISYVSPWFDEERVNCWCEYKRTADQIQSYNLWASIKNPKIHGRGYGQLIDGFDGIKNASNEALKDAIRSYYRNVIKNKPKEITGMVLIRDVPTIGIDAGRYVINLDFFLECGRIKEYTQF